VPPAFCETLREPIELRYRHRKQSGGAGQFADVLIEMRPLVDIAVVLKDGKHHAVDSADFAFRTAARNAVRSALDQADLVLLKPIMKVAIHVPSVFSGGVIAVISNRKGQVLGFAAEDGKAGWVVLEALIPLVAQDGLCHGLASASCGTGWFETAFDHYEEVRQDDLAPV